LSEGAGVRGHVFLRVRLVGYVRCSVPDSSLEADEDEGVGLRCGEIDFFLSKISCQLEVMGLPLKCTDNQRLLVVEAQGQ
jgi:hypothetical protein